jgi:hypothetical protein
VTASRLILLRDPDPVLPGTTRRRFKHLFIRWRPIGELLRERSERRYEVWLDDQQVGTVSAGKTVAFEVASGQHEMKIRCTRHYDSPALRINTLAGEEIRVRCGPDLEGRNETLSRIRAAKGSEKYAGSRVQWHFTNWFYLRVDEDSLPR